MTGSAPDEKTWRDAAGDLVEALLEIGRDGEDVAGVAERHLLAQVDAELVVVGRVERRDAADALRPEAGAGPVGGAAVERDADDRRVILADVADVLDIGRLQEGVDAGEMRQLAAREGRDRLVGQRVRAGQAHVERPLLLLAPAVLRQLPLGLDRLPALRVAGVEIGMVRRCGGWRRVEAGAAVAAFAGCLWPCEVSLRRRRRIGGFRPGRPDQRGHFGHVLGRSPVLAVERQIVGDRRAVGGRELRIVTHLVEDEHAGAELEGLGDVVGDHEHGHAVLAPERGQQLLHVDADAGIERAERLVEEQDLRPPEQGLGDGEALLHAAGELGRVAVARLGEADPLEHRLDLVARRLAPAAEDAAERPPRAEVLDQQQVLDAR